MTKVITRLFAKESTARIVSDRLGRAGFPRNIVKTFSAAGGADAAALIRADVDPATAEAYAARMAGGAVVLMVRARNKPLAAARIARDILRDSATVDMGDLPEEVAVIDPPDHAPGVMKDHPLMLTARPDPDRPAIGTMSSRIGFPEVIDIGPANSAIPGGKLMTAGIMPLLSTRARGRSVLRDRYMSRAFWPMPLLSRKPRRNSATPGGDLPFSRVMGWPTISERR